MRPAYCHSLADGAPAPILPRLLPPLLALAAFFAAGCDSGDARSADADSASGAPRSASIAASPAGRLLERAMKQYSEAASYADAGELRESVTSHGQTRESEAYPFSVTFARPNRLRFHSLGATVVCDGERMWGVVLAPECEGQVLMRPAPPELRIGHVFAEPNLTLSAQGKFQIAPPQLSWLLSEAAPPLPAGAAITQLADAMLPDPTLPQGGAPCHRVQVTVDDDPCVYWLDARSLVLRRFEFPSKRIAAQAAGDHGETVKVWADFKAAQFQPKLPPEAFAFEAPATAQLVKHFVAPPPAPPSPLLGRPVGQFTFFDMQGNPVTHESLRGKVAALEMWVSFHGGYQRSLPQFEKVYQHYAHDSRVAMLAVNDDAADVPDEKVSRAIEAIGVRAPLVRDRSEAYKSVFQLEGWPTIVLIGADGVVEDVTRLDQDEQSETLSGKIDALLAGHSLFAAEIEKYQRAKRRHDSEMTEALVGVTREIEIPQAVVAPAGEPTAFKRSRRWVSTEIKSPGNLLAVGAADGAVRLLAIEAARNVVELDPADGSVVARRVLEIPPDAAISYLRTAVDGSGQRMFAAFASAAQQVFVFDSDWKLRVAYPSEGKHPGLADALLADLDGDGQLELQVGYWGSVGVQTANLEGKRLRANRSIENVLRLAVSPPDSDGRSRLLCSNGGPSIVLLDHALAKAGEIPTPNRSVHGILPRADGDSPEIGALSSVEVGATTALGLGFDGQERWTHDLPRGVPRYPVEPLVLVPWPSGAMWLAPGADGSLHFLGPDGQLVDRFNYGRLATGIAGFELDGKTTLVVATPEDVTAWTLENP